MKHSYANTGVVDPLEALMKAMKFSVSSSSAISEVEMRAKKRASISLLYGLYRAEIDISHLIKDGLISNFIADCLQVFGGTRYFIVFSGIEDVRLDGRFSLVSSIGTGAAYQFIGSLSNADLDDLLSRLPYGAVSILNASDDIVDDLSRQNTMAMDFLLEKLGTKLNWVIEYDESGIVTLLAREQSLIWQQIMRAVQQYVDV